MVRIENIKKSQLALARMFKYLGWEWNSTDMEVMLNEERRVKIRDELRRMRKSIYNHKLIQVHNMAKLMGILSAARI
jgi:hypothetical protein